MAYNKAGDDIWVSAWDNNGEIVIFGGKTLQGKARLAYPVLVTPSGKLTQYNTRHDIH